MARLFYHVMQDNLGNLLFDVTGTMRLAGTGALATVYGDDALTIPIGNPMTNHPSFGSFKCYLPPGSYDFYMAKAGYTFETLTGVQGLGTMAAQNANAVAITGGGATFTGAVGIGIAPTVALDVSNDAYIRNVMGVKATPNAQAAITVGYTRSAGQWALQTKPDSDSGGSGIALYFANAAGSAIGSISTTGAATAFNTTSDARLKFDVDDLTGELAIVQALRPVRFKWLADNSDGVGFLASEVAALVQGVISGEPDAVDPDGTILPQMIDYSKLVPFLVGAIKTLTARLVVLEDALGI